MMVVDQIRSVGIVGAGLMGHGIAQLLGSKGIDVHIYDNSQEVLEAVPAKVKSNFDVFLRLGLAGPSEVERTLEHITLCDEVPSLCDGVQLIIEAVSERLEIKHGIFEQIERHVNEEVILASNTSAISITEIAEALKHRERFLGTHFWNPPHILPCVEVIKGRETVDPVMDLVYQFMKRLDKEPVRVNKDIPGFLGNRLQHAMWREAVSLAEKGIASAEDIDKVVKYGFGLRLPFVGPLETADLAGLDLSLDVHEYLFKYLNKSVEPSPLLRKKVQSGTLGVKTGQGFYEWSEDRKQSVVENRDFVLLRILQEVLSVSH